MALEPVNSSHGQLITPKNRVTHWPSCLTVLWRVDRQSVNSSHGQLITQKNSCDELTVLFLPSTEAPEADIIMRMGAASAVGARLANGVIMRWRHNDNSWLMEIWRLATCGHGLQRSRNNDWLFCSVLCLWQVDCVTSWPHDEFTGSPRRRCLGMSQTLVKELTVEDGADFRSTFLTDIETFQNLWCMMTPYIEKEDSDLRPCVTARERLQISCYRYWLTALSYILYGISLGWRHVLGRIRRPVSYGVKTRTRMLPVLTKKHNMSSSLEDFRQKFSRTRFPVHTAVCHPYNPAGGRIIPGRAQRVSHGSIKSPVLHPCYMAVWHGPCYTAVCIGLNWRMYFHSVVCKHV